MSYFNGTKTERTITQEDLRLIGEEALAYIREISVSDFKTLYPGMLNSELPYTLYALLGADGEPILISDDRKIAEANADHHDLQMVSLH